MKNIPFELTELDLTKPMPDGFLALNPLGQVPAIQHRGIVLNESSIIIVIPEQENYRRVLKWREALLRHPIVMETGLSEEAFIKYYDDYALGYGNGAIPNGHTHSSFDTTVPLAQRPLPPRPAGAGH